MPKKCHVLFEWPLTRLGLVTKLGLINDDLKEDREDNGGEHCGDKHLLGRDDLHVDHLDKGEANGTPEAAIGHDKLFLKIDSFDTMPVGQPRQSVDAFSTTTTNEDAN